MGVRLRRKEPHRSEEEADYERRCRRKGEDGIMEV